jgi:hypothetical protein
MSVVPVCKSTRKKKYANQLSKMLSVPTDCIFSPRRN